MKLNLIAACDRNGVIGVNGAIPWNIPEDNKRFRDLTLNHPVIMGRKTWASLPRKPLKDRTNVVVTKQYLPYGEIPDWICGSLTSALYTVDDFLGFEEAFIIGGERMYREALHLADKIYLTRVDQEVEFNEYLDEVAWFPLYAMKWSGWECTSEQKCDGFSFQEWGPTERRA